jgi:pilus assembly protein FimV
VQPAEPAVSAPDFSATMILSATAMQPAPVEAPPEESSEAAVLDFDLDLDAAEPAAANAASDSNNAEVAALDIDFDMPATAPVDTLDVPLALDIGDISAPQEPAPAPVQAIPLDANNIDFEFDLGEPAPAPEPEPEPEPKLEPEPEPESIAALDVDLGFEMPVAPEPALSSAAPALDMAMDFDMPAAAPQMAEPLMAPGIDLAGISLDLDAPEPSISAEPEIAVSPASTSDSAGASAIPDNPEVATKLELALAYEEMGDRDGARELYQEAFNEGSPGQQAAARAKLDGLG